MAFSTALSCFNNSSRRSAAVFLSDLSRFLLSLLLLLPTSVLFRCSDLILSAEVVFLTLDDKLLSFDPPDAGSVASDDDADILLEELSPSLPNFSKTDLLAGLVGLEDFKVILICLGGGSGGDLGSVGGGADEGGGAGRLLGDDEDVWWWWWWCL